MCDYSLAGLRTRLAVEGEELVVYRFPTGSIGLTSASEVAAHKKEFRGWRHWFNPREIPCAVCIPPGARLLLRNIPEHLQRQLGVGAVENVVFTQRSAEAYQFRDAVRFRNGREVPLQLLNCRQIVEVLSLCSGDRREEEHQRREEEYSRIFVGVRLEPGDDGRHSRLPAADWASRLGFCVRIGSRISVSVGFGFCRNGAVSAERVHAEMRSDHRGTSRP